MNVELKSVVDRLSTFLFSETPVQARATQSKSLTVEQVLASLAELTRAGCVFSADGGVSTGIVNIATIPATAAAWALYNGNPKGGKSLVMLNAWCRCTGGTGIGLGVGMFGCVDMLEATTIPTEYSTGGAINFSGHTGKTKAASKAVFAQGVTLTGTPAWALLASEDKPASASIGGGLWADLKGRFIVPPGFNFGGQVVGVVGAGSPLWTMGFTWAEVQLNLD